MTFSHKSHGFLHGLTENLLFQTARTPFSHGSSLNEICLYLKQINAWKHSWKVQKCCFFRSCIVPFYKEQIFLLAKSYLHHVFLNEIIKYIKFTLKHKKGYIKFGQNNYTFKLDNFF